MTVSQQAQYQDAAAKQNSGIITVITYICVTHIKMYSIKRPTDI